MKVLQIYPQKGKIVKPPLAIFVNKNQKEKNNNLKDLIVKNIKERFKIHPKVFFFVIIIGLAVVTIHKLIPSSVSLL